MTLHSFSTDQRKVILKPSKEKAILQKHHWIFSGAIAKLPSFTEGEILPVYSADQKLLGYAYFSQKGSIRGRMISFGNILPEEGLLQALNNALVMRQILFSDKNTTGYRLVNGEGDALPGLVIDQYGDWLVIQISTVGMDRLREFLIDYLRNKNRWKGIYEKSKNPARREEGLPDKEGWLWGEALEQIPFLENGLEFVATPATGQKTGFFLDQRDMRGWIKELARDKRILNCFAYSGGFSLAALSGGAKHVTSVDISQNALELAKQHTNINHFTLNTHDLKVADVFQFLREQPLEYELVILDPPAFTKKKQDIIAACRGYKEINRLAFEKMPSQSFLLTCSCSYYIDPQLFQTVIFQAAHDAGRSVSIIGRHRYAADHPINIFHPESDYLKSLLLFLH
ncbi:MAG: hypothetical protein K0S74_1357 [Chlamydiales bacterium]|jgi:23S rRNA (cytosine1962-C5)-methyltransferase|nr:hypothetical protein [Chlamydiales bacterium]